MLKALIDYRARADFRATLFLLRDSLEFVTRMDFAYDALLKLYQLRRGEGERVREKREGLT